MNKSRGEAKENNIRANMAILFIALALVIAMPFSVFLIANWISPCLDTGCGDGIGLSMVLIITLPLPLLLASKLVEPMADNSFENNNIKLKKKIASYCRICLFLFIIISIATVFIPR